MFLSVLVLSGCGASVKAPAPVTVYGTSQGPGSAGVHNVAKGETLWTISQRYNIVMRDIVLENNLAAPFRLNAGQRLILPAPRQYTVKPNDSVSSVARLFDVSASEIVRLNDLQAPYSLSAGQSLRLPSPVLPAAKPVQIASVVQDSVTSTVPTPQEKPAVVSRNNNQAIDSVVDGVLSDLRHADESSAVYQEDVARADIVLPPKKPAVPASAKPAPKVKKSVSTPKRASSKFLKPVNGKVISSYGAKTGGLHNDGINIAASRGSSVKAAENGVVVYAGNGLKGSGNLILLRHEDRWMTAYAHLQDIKVANGAVVKRGQAIGSVGSSGAVQEPQLHFEVRRGTKALNPKPYLE